VYGTEIGIPGHHMIIAILMIQFVGIPFAFAFGRLAGVIGAKRSVSSRSPSTPASASSGTS